MSISITRYVDITSGVGGASVVAQRSLVARIFTGNTLVPPQTFVSFKTAAAVGSYFGTGSEEYLRAVFYFSFISKLITVPQALQFARWTTANSAPSVVSSVSNVPADFSVWNAVTTGSLGLTVDGIVGTFTNIPFSSSQPSVTTSSSITVTGLTSTAALVPGMSVTGTGIAANTVIVTASGTSITLSIAATATGTPTLAFAVTGYDQIAAILQKIIRTNGNTNFSACTVVVNGNGQFVFTGGVVSSTQTPATISVQAGSAGTDITGLSYLGWLPAATYDSFGNYVSGAITSSGLGAETVTQALTSSAAASNNFGSFLFLNNLSLSITDAVAAAAWNITQNNAYMFCVPVTSSNYAAWSADVGGLGTYAGTALTLSGNSISVTATTASSSTQLTNVSNISALSVGMIVSGAGIPASPPVTTITAINTATGVVTLSQAASASATVVLNFILNEYPEQIPTMVLAATDYTAPNSAQNYMFQGPFTNLTPLVTTDAAANQYDAVAVNYYGNTQQAGQSLNFYQTGVLQGTSTSPLDMTSYTNEMWLKDAIAVQIMNLFLGLSQIPANAQGQGLLLTAIQAPINLALLNGSISVNKALTTTQKSYITSVTNDPYAYYQVQDVGYWIDCQIVPPVSPATAYTAAYTLVYSKDDVIRFVSGTDILI